MQFPISVYKVDDTIFLLQGEITEDFKSKLARVPSNYVFGLIRSADEPELTSIIFINGRTHYKDYRIVKTNYTAYDFEHYQNTIKYYAEQMGYEC